MVGRSRPPANKPAIKSPRGDDDDDSQLLAVTVLVHVATHIFFLFFLYCLRVIWSCKMSNEKTFDVSMFPEQVDSPQDLLNKYKELRSFILQVSCLNYLLRLSTRFLTFHLTCSSKHPHAHSHAATKDSVLMRLKKMSPLHPRLVPHPRSLSSRNNWRIPRLRPRRLWRRPRRLKTRRKMRKGCWRRLGMRSNSITM